MGAQLPGKAGALFFDLVLELSVVRCELLQLDKVTGSALEAIPRCDQFAVLA